MFSVGRILIFIFVLTAMLSAVVSGSLFASAKTKGSCMVLLSQHSDEKLVIAPVASSDCFDPLALPPTFVRYQYQLPDGTLLGKEKRVAIKWEGVFSFFSLPLETSDWRVPFENTNVHTVIVGVDVPDYTPTFSCGQRVSDMLPMCHFLLETHKSLSHKPKKRGSGGIRAGYMTCIVAERESCGNKNMEMRGMMQHMEMQRKIDQLQQEIDALQRQLDRLMGEQ